MPVAVQRPATDDVAQRCRIENDLRAGQCRQARRFGKPLVVADQNRKARGFRFVNAVAGVAMRKVILLVEQRIVGKVQFAIGRQQLAALVDYGR